MDMNLILGPIVLAVVANVSFLCHLLPVSCDADWLGSRVGCVVWDVRGAVVHILDLWVQGSMAHQVRPSPHTSVLLPFCTNHFTPSFSELRMLIYCAYYLTLPHTCGLLFLTLGTLTLRLCRGDVLGYIPHHVDRVDVVELYRR